ncbi:Glycerol-3-phosphate dehydrogenase [Salix suchowensis]|nr:Glycerol-3-phosphate dehydrogenase [Salix suchowensis]
MVPRENLKLLRPRLDENKLPLLIFVNKGIEMGTNALTLEIIADTCGEHIARAATFIVSGSGPSFAKESSDDLVTRASSSNPVVRRRPTSVSVASFTISEAEKATQVFHQPWFRWYVSHSYTGGDPIGLELAGALKNVYALAAGMSDGLGKTDSSYSPVMITRGLAEMTCIGTAFGAEPLTFLGLAGVGDLFLTCSSPTSRNYTIYNVLYEGKDVRTAVSDLMAMPPSRELELPPKAGGPKWRLVKKVGLE